MIFGADDIGMCFLYSLLLETTIAFLVTPKLVKWKGERSIGNKVNRVKVYASSLLSNE